MIKGLIVSIAMALAAPAAASAWIPPAHHVFVIVLENKAFADTFGPTGRAEAPYLNGTLVPKGELLTQYYGIGHNSADNYIAMISGQPPTPASKNDCPDPLQPVAPDSVAPYGVAKSDGCDYPPNFLTIGDQLTAHGFTWKGYNQGIPGPCSLADANGEYKRKHNPWVFFQSLRDSGQCQQNDVGLDQLSTDLQSVDTTPNLSFIVPDQCGDGHDNCTMSTPMPSNPVSDDPAELQQTDAFLKQWVPQILNSPAFKRDGLLVVTFDESEGDSTACCGEMPGPADPAPGGYVSGMPGPGGGVTGAVLVSKWITPGSAEPSGVYLDNQPYNHYSLLRSIEDLFGIKQHLGYAAPPSVVPFGSDVFNRPPGPSQTKPPASGGSPGGGSSSGGGQPGNGASGGGEGAVKGEHVARTACGVGPRSVFRLIHRPGRLRISGSSESACGTAVRVIQVAVARRVGKGCRWLSVAGVPRRASSCSRPFWLLARGTGNSWQLSLGHIGHGSYVVRVRAIDASGRRESARALSRKY